jgi:hypothetical protein
MILVRLNVALGYITLNVLSRLLDSEYIVTHFYLFGIMIFPHFSEFLRLESNKFTGKIPEEVYNNIELTNIYLSNNALTGTLSSSITKLVDIKEFVVKSNLLTGPIPNDVSNLKSLSEYSLRSMPCDANETTMKLFCSCNLYHSCSV